MAPPEGRLGGESCQGAAVLSGSRAFRRWPGARFGEIAGLTWADVNLDARILTFRRTKTGDTRRVPMTDAVFETLRARPRDRLTDYVFPGPRGGRWKDPPFVFRQVADELFNQGIPRNDRRNRVVFHTLRHTAASWMVMHGVPLPVVGEVLGHKTPGMTKRYAHLTPDAQREAAKTLDQLARPKAEVIHLPTTEARHER
ncbi:MAG: site-specific integrase [Deltaproteobacteria bacterium]|nr:site-specific integrase [Deltaproteobacteria bacterium]